MRKPLEDNVMMFFVEEDGIVVSSLCFYWVKLPSRFLGVVEEVKTDEAYRRRGFATKLMHEAIEFGKELGVRCIELCVRDGNTEAIRLYEKLGFQDRKNGSYRLNLRP